MFCPECRAEYRADFSRCADCDVDLVQELPAELPAELPGTQQARRENNGRTGYPTGDSIGRFRTGSLTKSALIFGLHQFIGMYGIPFTAPLMLNLIFNFLLLFGHGYPRRTIYSIATETPYFPVQIIFALLLGWLLGRSLRHRSMVWVWVLPLAILCYSLLTATVLMPQWSSVLTRPGVGQSRFSHYFGWGCQPSEHCLDQLVITMPFYSSFAYSTGAALSRRMLGYARYQDKTHFWAVMFAGVIILTAFTVDLAISIHQGGWHGSYLLSALSPMGLGAFLLYVDSTIRRQLVPSA